MGGCPQKLLLFPDLAFMELMKRMGNLEQSHTAKCNFNKHANKNFKTLTKLSMVFLTQVVLLEEWSKIPINTLLNLVESLPRRVEAVIAAKGGPTPY